MNSKQKDFLIGSIIGTVITVAVLLINPEQTDSLVFRFCDGFFVAAVMVLGFGGLMFARNKGTFDMLAYSVKSVFHIHYPGASIGDAREKEEDFVGYRERKAKTRRPATGFLLSGLVFFILSLIMLMFYYIL